MAQYTLNGKPGGPQSRCARSELLKKVLATIETQFLGRPARSLVTIPTRISRFFNITANTKPTRNF